MMKKLSVIVPVYNVEEYIGNCLQSLVCQGFEQDEYEIICVNDGSKDNSQTEIEKMMAKHPEIKLINQENTGVSSARNQGIRAARGKYIYFCDSDDYLAANYLKKITDLMDKEDAPSAFFNFETVAEDSEFTETQAEELVWEKDKTEPLFSGNIWRFVFLREAITDHEVFFDEALSYGEDEVFVFDVCRHLDYTKHISIHMNLYKYRLRESSVTHVDFFRKIEKHQDNMLKMALHFQNVKKENDVSAKIEKQLQFRISYALTNYLYDAFRVGAEASRKAITTLEEKGLYPYAFIYSLLKPRDIKTYAVNVFRFFFPLRCYYLSVSGLADRLRSGRQKSGKKSN